MNTIEAKFRIVTPMFLGGADQGVADGIRPPSVKGALRFWWRALNWGNFQQKYPENQATALQKLNEEEARLFGAAKDENKKTGGQGCFLLSIVPPEKAFQHTLKDQVHSDFANNDASRYLAYGLVTGFYSKKTERKAGQLERDCLNENQFFTVKLLFRGDIESSIREALIAFGLLGGLGNRVRHGMGCIALETMTIADHEPWVAPTTLQDYKNKIEEIIPKNTLATDLPPFSAFSIRSRIDSLFCQKTAFQVLEDFGRAMLFYRSWGKDNKVLREDSEKNFQNDHDWSKASFFRCKKETPSWKKEFPDIPYDYHPQRVMFGLPHNYGKPKQQQVTPATKKRRSSPLLFHVHPLAEGNYIGLSILLKSDFLPVGEQINAGGTCVTANIDWLVLTDFLDGNDAKGNKRFPDAKRLHLIGDES